MHTTEPITPPTAEDRPLAEILPQARRATRPDAGGLMTTRCLTLVPDALDAASLQTVRPRLFGIACRVLGSANDADDVVQDAWIRWQRTDRVEIRDPAGFVITTTRR